MHIVWKNAENFKTIRKHLKNPPLFEKCTTLEKMRHTCKNAAQLGYIEYFVESARVGVYTRVVAYQKSNK